ncbi:hypothetical protein [Streptomyces sp. NPDC046859]|uniref:hypothetical protein n=1 Tax=Streptomyces sp. NPDC046859 TaxID=3155734 RepID=UPI00340BE560
MLQEQVRHLGGLLHRGEGVERGRETEGRVVGEARVAEGGEEQQQTCVGVDDARRRRLVRDRQQFVPGRPGPMKWPSSTASVAAPDQDG